MASNLHVRTEQPPAHTPLLASNSNRNDVGAGQGHQRQRDEPDEPEETRLDQMLRHIEMFLTLLGFKQSSFLSLALSWTSFVVVGVVVPVLMLEVDHCSDRESCHRKDFEINIVAFQACLAAVSLLCLSRNLRKYGLRRFLFVDRYSGNMASFQECYVKQISESSRLLVLWVLPCFFLKTIREIIGLSHVNRESWWPSVAVSLASIISWTYEHIRLRYQLSRISHRFRIYLLLVLFVVTVSQIVTLIQVIRYGGIITFVNGGDFAVSTLVQVVGIIICLHAATKISRRAQNIVSLASRWHALVTCTTSHASRLRSNASVGNLESANLLNSQYFDHSESDLESFDHGGMPTNTRLATYMSSNHKRQAFAKHGGR